MPGLNLIEPRRMLPLFGRLKRLRTERTWISNEAEGETETGTMHTHARKGIHITKLEKSRAEFFVFHNLYPNSSEEGYYAMVLVWRGNRMS